MDEPQAPIGYRLVKIHKKGRKNIIDAIPKEDLTDTQIRNRRYRDKNPEKLVSYAKTYYAMNKEKILQRMKANYDRKKDIQ
jgi:hypothetical protein